jgi:cytochrome c oxidase accessory protein FixG
MSEEDKGRVRQELHSERLGTTDAQGHRVYVHPEDVKGEWRDKRRIVYWFLILVYFFLPWVNWGGKQIILLDIANREFTFFGNTFFAHDGPLVFFIFVTFVLAFGFITAQWGRLWCGWGCPQTVFIDAVYRPIERMIEGRSRARKNLDKAPWSFEKLWKRTLKWSLYLLVSLHLSHTFLGYFVGARKLFWITLSPPTEHMTMFITMWVVTGIFIFDFGWFREQFCIIACPYGRFQSVMMDEHSLVIAYDESRGEPRRNLGVLPKEEEGDCIDCQHCVKVCPTGIDIRRGTQLECIACTNCIDACDEIMGKLGRPKGLIRYDSEVSLKGGERKFLRFRPFFYAFLIIVTLTVFSITLVKRGELRLQFLRASAENASPFQTIKRDTGEIEVVNHYKASIYYNGPEDYKLFFVPKDKFLPERLRIVTRKVPHPIVKGSKYEINLFFRFQKSVLNNGRKTIKVQVYSGDNLETAKFLREEEVKLVGPF